MRKKLSLHKQDIIAAFDKVAETYDAAAFVEQEVGARLLERLAYFNLRPKRILDIGCSTATFTQQLQNLYPNASIIALDISLQMLNFATTRTSNISFCCADVEQLPFAAHSFDLIIANCCFMWLEDWSKLITNLTRVFAKDGLVFFSYYGPNTLTNIGLENKWLDAYSLSNLVGTNFKDPVIETENITFQYHKLRDLLQDLHDTGTCTFDANINFPQLELPISATFEIIYCHAWDNGLNQYKDAEGKVYIPVEAISFTQK
jgi:malonyl-CoA O-methyltransferase